MKVSQKEKEKIMSTSKAQSLMSSRRASMDVSRSNISAAGATAADNSNKVIQSLAAVEREENETADVEQCENKPSLFAAEQTWPTEDEIREAQKKRRVSNEDDSEMITTESAPVAVGGF